MDDLGPVLLTGATGFVGSHAYAALRRAGHFVVCTSRDPQAAAARFPGREFRHLNLDQPETLEPALVGCRAAIYLVHAMGSGDGYESTEQEEALRFREAAAQAGLERIVYLGGVQPSHGEPSTHLRSRRRTGECLRYGAVPTIELRAAMIVGAGSQSFRMVRDLSARLPLMVLPGWSKSLSAPVGIQDVALALTAALEIGLEGSAVYNLPGPEVLSARDILLRTARLLGRRPRTLTVPLFSPRLSAYWIRLITRADPEVSRELVEGLQGDLLGSDPALWDRIGHAPQPFDQAVRAALEEEHAQLGLVTRWLEQALAQLSSRRTKP